MVKDSGGGLSGGAIGGIVAGVLVFVVVAGLFAYRRYGARSRAMFSSWMERRGSFQL